MYSPIAIHPSEKDPLSIIPIVSIMSTTEGTKIESQRILREKFNLDHEGGYLISKRIYLDRSKRGRFCFSPLSAR
jgi:hypothetical protein